MIITHNHLSRRTVLRGMGATLALPFLDAMAPAQTLTRKTAAVSRVRLACIEMVHGSAGSTQYGLEQNLWMPAKVGPDFEFTEIARAVPRLRHGHIPHRPEAGGGVYRGRGRRRPLPLERGLPHGGAPEADRRVRRAGGHVHRSNLRAAVRAGHAAAVAPARDRKRRRRRDLRLQLRLRVFGADQLVVADDADAADDRSADGLRKPVRRRRDGSRAGGAAAGEPQHPRRHHP